MLTWVDPLFRLSGPFSKNIPPGCDPVWKGTDLTGYNCLYLSASRGLLLSVASPRSGWIRLLFGSSALTGGDCVINWYGTLFGLGDVSVKMVSTVVSDLSVGGEAGCSLDGGHWGGSSCLFMTGLFVCLDGMDGAFLRGNWRECLWMHCGTMYLPCIHNLPGLSPCTASISGLCVWIACQYTQISADTQTKKLKQNSTKSRENHVELQIAQ